MGARERGIFGRDVDGLVVAGHWTRVGPLPSAGVLSLAIAAIG